MHPLGTLCACRGAGSAEEGVDEGGSVEGGHVVGALAQSDELDGYAELALHLDDDPALGGPVELGQDDAGDVDDLTEDARLDEAVLAGGGVEDEEHLGDGGLLLD